MRFSLRRTRRLFLVTLVTLLVFTAGTWLYFDYSLERVPAFTDYQGRADETAGTNWLLVGSDSRQGLTEQQEDELSTGDTSDAEGARTDTIMLLHIPAGSQPPTLVSLPRDSLAPIKNHGPDKLNAAYSIGGPTLLSRTTEELTGVHIDHYLEIGLGGFAGVVDAVGGVNMCVPEPIHDPKINLDLEPGCQQLNGPQALGFVRSRAFERGDLERAEHQRQFLAALVSKSTSREVLLNPLRSVPMALRASKTITVSDGDHLHALGWMANEMRGAGTGGVVTATVADSGTIDIPGVGSVLLWDKEKSAELFTALKQDKPLPPGVTGNPQ